MIASVFYECLSNFCLLCGMIGHQDMECKLPANNEIEQYNLDLRMAPIHPEDPRCCYLLEITGQVRQQQPLPWRVLQDGHVRYPVPRRQ